MLNPRGIGVRDLPPPFPKALDDAPRIAWIVVPFIETLMPDDVAWEALFDDEFRIDLARRYGPWTPAKLRAARKRRSRKAPPQPTGLF